jgi:hypothetical protein
LARFTFYYLSVTAQLNHTIVWCPDMQKSATSLAHRDARINHNDGGRGMCFEDPGGHLLEIITRAHGSGG